MVITGDIYHAQHAAVALGNAAECADHLLVPAIRLGLVGKKIVSSIQARSMARSSSMADACGV
jgi:hypothetical protein